ncbi:MAG: aminotransferase class V-fold PLP-dependent enzyme [Mycoplasma sp.]|nr:aminotransferase class V-fold PLP-dependent enzyme [Candidatus Hennigella equi]
MNNVRKDFPWITKHPKLLYFDSAATSLKPQSVIDAISNYYINYGTNTHNSDSAIAFKTTSKVQAIRNKTAKLFNAKASNIVFTSGATEGLNLIAYGIANGFIKPKQEVLISKLEHASNLLPWIRLAKQGCFKLKYVDEGKIPTAESYLKAITRNTKVIAFAGSSNILGNNIDYVTLVKQAKKLNPNIIIVMDAAQYLPHHKIDVTCGIDFIACSCHKLLGPTGLGIVYMADKWLSLLQPLKYGGGMNQSIDKENYVLYNNVDKFEGGTLPLAQIFGWEAAIDYLNKIGFNNISKYQHDLKKYFVKQLAQIKNIVVYNKQEPEAIIYFNINKVHAQDLASWLGTKGVICRAGLSCAKLAHHIIKTQAAVRLSLYFYNTKEEIDKFVKLLKKFKKGDEIIL